MSELLSQHYDKMSNYQIAQKLRSLAVFIGKNETGLAKEKSIALLSIAAARAKAKMKPRRSPKNRGSIMKKEVTK